MRRGRSTTKRVVLTLSFLFAAWLPLLGYGHFVETSAVSSLTPATWITGQEIRRLAEYHGADALKITQDRVFIRRNSKWIPVLKRDPG